MPNPATNGNESVHPDEWIIPILEKLGASAEDIVRAGAAPDRTYWEAAVRLRVVAGAKLLERVSAELRTPIADSLDVSDDAKAALAARVARRHHVIPLNIEAGTLNVATSNPWDLDAERSIVFVTGRSIKMWLAPPNAIEDRIEEIYGTGARPAADESRSLYKPATLMLAVNGEPVIRLVDRIVDAGIAQRASDIHLEPEEDGIAVRFRVDGILRPAMILPRAVGVPLVSRIKIMAKMDIADRMRPQGGHASVGTGTSRVDLRVSTLPASHGEKVVIRILDPRAAIRSLDSLGLDKLDAPRMERLLDVREGLVLVTGPTGSGKTTTLYAALRQIQQKGLNIITVEDPVEYRIPGIVQVQINEKAGLSFASALRSILRQDPDVVLIGEIRDRETAAIAIQASLTGHLVFATLHTNDACSSITRLTDLGVDPARLAAALKGIIAQRLIRRLCPDCRIVANDGAPAQLRHSVTGDLLVHTAVGCDHCAMSGYVGRLAVTEIVVADAELERGIATCASTDQLITMARSSGCRSLWESGLNHLVAGSTSGDELLRVLDQHVPSEPVERDLIGVDGSRQSHTRAESRSTFDFPDAPLNLRPPDPELPMTGIVAGVVDVYVIRPLAEGWKVLTVQRADDTRCPGAWETVHGRIESGEKPEDAAVREVREETGLGVSRLYNVTVQPFYLHKFGTVQLAVVFAAFVDEPGDVSLGEEHQAFEWLSPDDASSRFIWPREREALGQILQLLGSGDAGPAEDVLRVR